MDKHNFGEWIKPLRPLAYEPKQKWLVLATWNPNATRMVDRLYTGLIKAVSREIGHPVEKVTYVERHPLE